MRTACLEAAKWPRDVRIGVNVSPIQFANPALPGIVTNALAKAGIAAHIVNGTAPRALINCMGGTVTGTAVA